MYQDGFKNIVAIDWSMSAIETQRVLAEGYTPGIQYLCMNASNLYDFKEGQFDYVIEKGMIDAVLTQSQSSDMVEQILSEVYRVLTVQGVFISFQYGKES